MKADVSSFFKSNLKYLILVKSIKPTHAGRGNL